MNNMHLCWLGKISESITGAWESNGSVMLYRAHARVTCMRCGRILSDIEVNAPAYAPVTQSMAESVEEQCLTECRQQSNAAVQGWIEEARALADLIEDHVCHCTSSEMLKTLN